MACTTQQRIVLDNENVINKIDFKRNASGVREVYVYRQGGSRSSSNDSLDQFNSDQINIEINLKNKLNSNEPTIPVTTTDSLTAALKHKMDLMNTSSRSLRRTVSESSELPKPVRGILKYSPRWIRQRARSESNCGDEFHHYIIDDEISQSLDSVCLSDAESTEEVHRDHESHPKKSVHFDNRVLKTIFRQDLAIIQCRNRNRRRVERRKEQKRKANLRKSEEELSVNQEITEIIDDSQRVRTRQDSGYDSEDFPRDCETLKVDSTDKKTPKDSSDQNGLNNTSRRGKKRNRKFSK